MMVATNDNGEAEDTFECWGVLVLEEVLLVVGLSGGSLAEEPACVALPPRDLVGILRSVEVASSFQNWRSVAHNHTSRMSKEN